MEKRCFKCGIVKHLDEFYKHPQMGDGHLNKCKECSKKDIKENRNKHLEYYREYDIKRSDLPCRKELRHKVGIKWIKDGRAAQVSRRYKERYPERYVAHYMLKNAIRDGKVKKPKACEFCGLETNQLQGHHSDYSKPYDVKWLCVECHGKTRRKYPRVEEENATYRVS
jgi:hypothetical protein